MSKSKLQSYRIRPLSHFGAYPSGDIEIGHDLFLRSGRTLFTCTKNKLVTEYGRTLPEQPAFELENWTLQEVRLFASLYLGNGPYRSCKLYPLPVSQDIVISSLDDVIADGSLFSELLSKMQNDDYFMRANLGLIPKELSNYETIEWDDQNLRQANLLWNNIDIQSPVLIRGLYSLLKSEMLFNHFQFRTASISEVHISLDAAHSLILSRLKELGNKNPTSLDAGKYFEDLFEEPNSGRHFFQDYYEDRIKNFHVDNRFGAEPIPSFSIDDIRFLQDGLRALFYTIVTGEHFDFKKMWNR